MYKRPFHYQYFLQDTVIKLFVVSPPPSTTTLATWFLKEKEEDTFRFCDVLSEVVFSVSIIQLWAGISPPEIHFNLWSQLELKIFAKFTLSAVIQPKIHLSY